MTLDKNWWSDLEKLTSLCDADARKQRNLIEGFFFFTVQHPVGRRHFGATRSNYSNRNRCNRNGGETSENFSWPKIRTNQGKQYKKSCVKNRGEESRQRTSLLCVLCGQVGGKKVLCTVSKSHS